MFQELLGIIYCILISKLFFFMLQRERMIKKGKTSLKGLSSPSPFTWNRIILHQCTQMMKTPQSPLFILMLHYS